MATITINEVEIPEADIRAEMQHHPAGSLAAARDAAAQALVVRELLLQEARRLKLTADPIADEAGRRETDEESLIRTLIEDQVPVPAPDDEVCRRYFENNGERFRSPDLYEATHILLPADPRDPAAVAAAKAEAETLLLAVEAAPDRFAEIAQARSACSSAKHGGRLGQIAQGPSEPEFETFLAALEDGQLCPVPVRSRHGWHIVRLDRRVPGRQLPFETVRERIGAYLQERAWRRAVAQYIQILAGRARISGIAVAAAESPLVQ